MRSLLQGFERKRHGAALNSRTRCKLSESHRQFQIAANPTNVTVSAPGRSASTALTITPLGGFNQTVSFTCSEGLPSEANCSFTRTASGATMTITTMAPSARLHEKPFGTKALFYAVLLPGLLGLAFGRGKRTLGGMRLLALLCATGFCSVWLACGGNNSSSTPNNPGTPKGTSTVTITATAGSLSHQIDITLTVE